MNEYDNKVSISPTVAAMDKPEMGRTSLSSWSATILVSLVGPLHRQPFQ